MSLDFFYDQQLRRYLLQFTRIFTLFQYQAGVDSNGLAKLKRVPARYASRDRMVGHILKNNSENVILSAPFITTWIKDLAISRSRTQNPNFVGTVQVSERKIDKTTNTYSSELGDTYTLKRFMPVPYDLTMQVDIWTTNELQKQQLLEQILVLFNPAIDIQSSVNPLDWTSLTYVELTAVRYDSKTIPIGTTDNLSISTLTFTVPVWINPLSQLKKQTIIETICTTIFSATSLDTIPGFDKSSTGNAEQGGFGEQATPFVSDVNDLITRKSVTFENFKVLIQGDKAILLGGDNSTVDADGNLLSWKKEIDYYGELRPNISQLQLNMNNTILDLSNLILGNIDLDPNDQSKLIFTVDAMTLPVNTLSNIDAMIDPTISYPTKNLAPASSGQRYIITKDIGPGTVAWGSLTASVNDIISFDGSVWSVAFDASGTTTVQLVLNTLTNKQLEWNGTEWVFAVDREYEGGFWKLLL